MTRSKNGRFCKSVEKREKEISKQLDTKRGRKALAKAMVEPIRDAIKRGAFPPPQHRPTMEEIKEAKEKEAKRLESRRETINFLGEVSLSANEAARDSGINCLAKNLRRLVGNAKLNEELKEIESRRNEIKSVEDLKIKSICESEKFKKLQEKLAKDIRKKIKKVYKKSVKKHGKKISRVLFEKTIPEIIHKEIGISQIKMKKSNKKLFAVNKEYSRKIEEIEEDKKHATSAFDKSLENLPRVTPEDLSVADNSSIWRKERVKLPGDNLLKNGIDIREIDGFTMDEILDEKHNCENYLKDEPDKL